MAELEKKIRGIIQRCLICDSEYKTKPSHAHRRKYCSYVCFNEARKETLRGENNPCWRGGRPRCSDCSVQLSHWGHYTGKPERCNACMRKFNRGANHYNWLGGITPVHKIIRNSFAMKQWRRSVLERDNFTCVWCKQVGGKLHADHIKRFSEYPELRFEITNGRTLCVVCHRKTDTYGRKGLTKKICAV